jgi:hypothetical protein
MSDEDFFKWLRSKGVNDKDCKTLSGKYNVPLTILYREYYHPWCTDSLYYIENGITASGFLLCDTEDFDDIFDDIGLTKIGKKLLLKIFTEVKGIVAILPQVESLCMGFTLTHIIIIITMSFFVHSSTLQASMINSLQKTTTPMRGHGVKYLSILGKQREEMNAQSMV